jgi:hypothetical protein
MITKSVDCGVESVSVVGSASTSVVGLSAPDVTADVGSAVSSPSSSPPQADAMAAKAAIPASAMTAILVLNLRSNFT